MTDLVALRREARRQGWRVVVTGGNHLKWIPPSGRDFVIGSLTPSRPSSIHHLIRMMRKRGFEPRKPGGRPGRREHGDAR